MKNKKDLTKDNPFAETLNNHPAFGGQGRQEYTKWFLEAYKSEPRRTLMIEQVGEKYYNEVIKIHEQRLSRNNFNIGPQSVDEWEILKKKVSKP